MTAGYNHDDTQRLSTASEAAAAIGVANLQNWEPAVKEIRGWVPDRSLHPWSPWPNRIVEPGGSSTVPGSEGTLSPRTSGRLDGQ